MTAMEQYQVTYSAEDVGYVATVDRFPSLSWIDTDPVEALNGLVILVRLTVADMEREGS